MQLLDSSLKSVLQRQSEEAFRSYAQRRFGKTEVTRVVESVMRRMRVPMLVPVFSFLFALFRMKREVSARLKVLVLGQVNRRVENSNGQGKHQEQ